MDADKFGVNLCGWKLKAVPKCSHRHTLTPSKTRKSCSISAEKREREDQIYLAERADFISRTHAFCTADLLQASSGIKTEKIHHWQSFLSQRGNLRDFFYRLRAPDKKSSV
jgi:hypothetical protein